MWQQTINFISKIQNQVTKIVEAYSEELKTVVGNASPELAQLSFMVGRNDCSGQRLNNATGGWVYAARYGGAHYFMDGFAIRDEGKSGATTYGNVRVYDTALGEWVVTFFLHQPIAPALGEVRWKNKNSC